VHRDLAARNVLLNSQFKCQVADFGLSRATRSSEAAGTDAVVAEEEEYYRPSGKNAAIPVRWTAPDMIETGRSTIKTDVWSYGITVMEICTNACGARFRTGFCIRRCHWIPRMFA
jgi:serine/threonine protein kinase